MGGKHSTGREETDVEGKQALRDVEGDREEKMRRIKRFRERCSERNQE